MSAPCSEVMLQLLFSSFQDQILLVQEEHLSSDQSKNNSISKFWHLIGIRNGFTLFLTAFFVILKPIIIWVSYLTLSTESILGITKAKTEGITSFAALILSLSSFL